MKGLIEITKSQIQETDPNQIPVIVFGQGHGKVGVPFLFPRASFDIRPKIQDLFSNYIVGEITPSKFYDELEHIHSLPVYPTNKTIKQVNKYFNKLRKKTNDPVSNCVLSAFLWYTNDILGNGYFPIIIKVA